MNYYHLGYLFGLFYFLGENVELCCSRRSRIGRRRKSVAGTNQLYHVNGWGTHAVDPEFLGHIQSTTVIAGKDAILRCSVENLGDHKVAWINVETKQQLSIATNVFQEKERIQVTTTNHTSWFLHIKNVTKGDSGYYMCQISTNPIKSQAGFLSVVEPPEFLTNMTNRNVTVMENSNVTLSCKANGNPSPVIKWKREDGHSFVVDNQMYREYVGDELKLIGVTRAHMAAYLCLASNEVPPAISRRIYLDVKFPPLIWIQNQIVGARQSIDVYLECHTEAHPTSENFWLRDDEAVVSRSTRYQTHLTRNSYTTYMKLTIRNLQPEDYGSYQCVAKNDIGETQGSIILYKPVVVPTPLPPKAVTRGPSTPTPRKAITVGTTANYRYIVTEVIRRENTNTPGKQQKYGHDRDTMDDSSAITIHSGTSCAFLITAFKLLWVITCKCCR